MLAGTHETPRPRAPARARRISNYAKPTTPPPAYAPTFADASDTKDRISNTVNSRATARQSQPRLETLLGSPMIATFQKMGWETRIDGSVSLDGREQEYQSLRMFDTSTEKKKDSAAWLKERSKEELNELLGRADDLIKERETELGHTAAVAKSLYENNVALKHKHQTLLGRLPVSPIASPAMSPVPLSRTPSSSISRSTSDSIISAASSPYLTYRAPTGVGIGAGRRVSVSPADISLLADQNAELLDKLERLETEAQHSDQSGRRVLKRLEKEIATLRDELEKTQARSQELEEKTKNGWDAEKVVEEALRKKKERQAKMRASKYNGQEPSQEYLGEETEIRDFAPGSASFGGPASALFASSSGPSSRAGSAPGSGRTGRRSLQTSPSMDWNSVPLENALISQLLEKIKELEETNTRIIEQQIETTNQLQAVQKDTEHIAKVYETLADQPDVELEYVDNTEDVDSSLPASASEGTVRRRRPGGAQTYDSHDDTALLGYTLHPGAHHRNRKSVIDYFEPATSSRGGDTIHFANSKPLNLPVPFPSNTHRHSWSMSSTDFTSPALSSLGLATPPYQRPLDLSPMDHSRPTLQSELGGAYNWGLSDKNHLRTSSLYELVGISAPNSPSPIPQVQLSAASPTNGIGINVVGSPLVSEPSSMTTSGAFPTPEAFVNSALKLSIEPPTPDRMALEKSASLGRQSARYQKMSQTVRSRTSRWVDGRFADTLTGLTRDDDGHSEIGDDDRLELRHDGESDVSRPVTPLPIRLASAIDSVMENFHGRYGSTGEIDTDVSDDESVANRQAVKVNAPAAPAKPQKTGVVGFVLEIWLWLQFCVIILVFLWAMAKRGPKSVLGEGDPRARRTSIRRR